MAMAAAHTAVHKYRHRRSSQLPPTDTRSATRPRWPVLAPSRLAIITAPALPQAAPASQISKSLLSSTRASFSSDLRHPSSSRARDICSGSVLRHRGSSASASSQQPKKSTFTRRLIRVSLLSVSAPIWKLSDNHNPLQRATSALGEG